MPNSPTELSDPMILATGTEASTAIAIIVAAGVAGQWIASALRIPSVLVLLLAGIVVGPVAELIDPVADLGPALFPTVGLAVGLLLFEGGLNLRLDRLEQGRAVVLRLVTVGALVTWLVAGVSVWLIFDVSRGVAALIGAILVVSGPTVIIPLLHQVRPREPSASVLRWEGIIIDPIGATLAIVVLDTLINPASTTDAAIQVGLTLGAGAAIGAGCAAVVLVAQARHVVPDRLHNPIILSAAVGGYALANLVAPEAGLMATTAMGLAIANQRWVPSGRINAFSEDVAHLILGGLFVTLGSLVVLDDIVDVLGRVIPLIAVLIVVARPLTVWVSTIGTDVARSDRRFIAAIAPRGIVAASVATVFANTLAVETGTPVPEIVPVVFSVVIATVAVYGLSARFTARRLRVAKPEPTGVAIVSNHGRAADLAAALSDAGAVVLVVTSSSGTQRRTRAAGILTYDEALDDEQLGLVLDALGIGQALVLSDDANLIGHAAHHLGEHLGRANVYCVTTGGNQPTGLRPAFGEANFEELTAADAGFVVADASELGGATPLFAVADEKVSVLNGPAPNGGRAVALVTPPAPPGKGHR